MATGSQPWCDFVIGTNRRLNVKCVYFNHTFWNDILLPKLIRFYENCVVPEIVSAVHTLGLPICDL